jgi:hypothetical protein
MELLAPTPPAEEPSGPTVGEFPAGAPDAEARGGGPYSIGPDSHERSGAEGDAPVSAPARAPRLTAKGLPKRTPRISTPVEAPRTRTGGVDAEALRRRLGGFHQGARKGARAAEEELAERTGQTTRPGRGTAPAPVTTDHGKDHGPTQDTAAVDTSGGTVEEASS